MTRIVTALECHAHELECLRLARSSTDLQERSALYGMARAWGTMAKFASQLEALDFHVESGEAPAR